MQYVKFHFGITKLDLFLLVQMVNEVHHLRAHKCTNILSFSDQVLISLRSAGCGTRTPNFKCSNVTKISFFVYN